jgi:hypothetical protein
MNIIFSHRGRIGRDMGRHGSGTGVIARENEILIIGMFLVTGLLACVVIPGLLIRGDQVFDNRGESLANLSSIPTYPCVLYTVLYETV